MYRYIRVFTVFSLLSLLESTGVSAFAQTITIEFPSYKEQQYTFVLKQGAGTDTVAVGNLDSLGRASFVLPNEYAGFRGVGNLSVPMAGISVNMIVNGEKAVTVRESDQPDSGIFENSPENTYLLDALARQGRMIEDYKKAVTDASPVRTQSLEKEYKSFRRELKDSPLYAARMVEILSCLSGMGDSLEMPPDSIVAGQHRFFTSEADLNDLYTSGFWQLGLQLWYETAQGNDSLLLDGSKKMLDRCAGDIPIRRELTQSIIRLFSKYAKDYLLPELGTEYLTMPLNGQFAPEIKNGDISFLPRQSLIVFYETGCGNCHYELEQLKQKYSLLTDNRIRVITVAADVDKDVFEETAASFPWTDRFCDLQGFDGDNFQNYGIVGTPTFILTDSEGIVRGRYAQLKELLE